jgi:hypothetical protein
MSDRTEFELLLRRNDVRLPSAWQAAWEEAEATLAAVFPEGYDVLEVGRLAFDSLHDDLKPAALDALFYGWWEAEQDRQDPCRPCGCPKRFNRHAWGCPEEVAR